MNERKTVGQEAAESLQKAGLLPFLLSTGWQVKRIIAIIDATIKEREAAIDLSLEAVLHDPVRAKAFVESLGLELVETPTPVLAPCPFCGGKELQKLQTFKDEIKFIRCESCQFGWIAVEDWNRRVQGSVAASTDDTKRLLKASNDLREYLEGMPLLE